MQMEEKYLMNYEWRRCELSEASIFMVYLKTSIKLFEDTFEKADHSFP